jgi:RHS repeat-associated protein
LTDALGSTRGLVDNNENLTDSYTYTPYGTLSDHNGTSNNNFLFTGEQRDKQSNDYYLRARYYSPESGRFISRDSYAGTAGNPITQNHYLYGNGNPLMFVDPSGHIGTTAEVNFNLVAMGSLSHSNIRVMTKVGSSILFQLRNNKKYYINKKYGEAHTSIYATDIQTRGGYKYDLGYDGNDPRDLGYLTFWEEQRIVGWIKKEPIDKNRNNFTDSFVKLSPIQFELWDQWIFKQYPLYSGQNPNTTRAHDYLADKINCISYAESAYSKALFIMLTTPSL